MSFLYIGLISFAVGSVLGWLFGTRVASSKQTQLKKDVTDLLADVHTPKVDAAKVQLWNDENALEQRRLREAAEVARNEAVKAANVMREVKPTLRLIQTRHRDVLS
jgi:hypothetical protein